MAAKTLRQIAASRPLKVLIAPDKFKGTLSAQGVAKAIARGIQTVRPNCRYTLLPLSDGGDGFVEAMVQATGGQLRWIKTINALGRPCRAAWGDLGRDLRGKRVAVIGLTEASALAQVPESKRNPLLTTNEGTGRILAEVIRRGFDKVVIGIGGSATTEGGIGLLAPLGFQFLDENGKPIPLTGGGLARLAQIVPPRKKWRTEFLIASDVTNPLYGLKGAAYIFGPQKGATPAMVRQLDANLRHLAAVTKKTFGSSPHDKPGAGAAGGCGYGLMAFLNARLVPGFNLLSNLLQLPSQIRKHDLIITGEGSIDLSTLHGKAPTRIAQMAHQYGKPIWAFCGQLKCATQRLPFNGVGVVVKSGVTCRQAMNQPVKYLIQTVERLARQWPALTQNEPIRALRKRPIHATA